MNSYWQKVEEAVATAEELPEAEFQIWLEEFCAGDEELKGEVRSLLSFEPIAETFLEKSIGEYAAKILPETETDFSGKIFGSYRIVREIGRGGMGAVFLAERADGEFRQRVALKIVRQTFIDRQLARHFKRERQILANLNHPFIARLLDGGVSEFGEPFLVMEFIEGETLLRFAAAENLDTRRRLKIFLKICAAVAYAHRNLIVHRDIKPSNILVTADSAPKLLDFGLAKALDETFADDAQTQTAFRALTPAYASPEQIRGEPVTTASDIYSLGKVLSELIENPNAELRKIAATALREEPDRRYPSVEAFAEDIENFLDGKPLKARPATFRYRAAKFIRRNKITAAAAVLIFLTLLGGVFATLRQSRQTQKEKEKAENVNLFLAQMLNYSNPEAAITADGRLITVKDVLDKAAAQIESEKFSAAPEVKADLHTIIGNSYMAHGNNDFAEKHLRAALAERLKTDNSESPAVIKIKAFLASVLLSLGKNAECQQLYDEIMPLLRAEFERGGVEPEYLADALHDLAVLRRAQGSSAEAEILLRESLALAPLIRDEAKLIISLSRGTLALALFDQGKIDEAIESARENVNEFRHRATVNTADFGYALTTLGSFLSENDQFAEADANLTQAEAIYRKLLGDSHLWLGDNLRIQANSLYKQGKFAEAQTKIAETLKIYRASTSAHYINFPTALMIQGLILNKSGRSEEAEKILREALSLREENLPPAHFLTSLNKSALGECLMTQNRFEEAERLLAESFESLKISQGAENPRTVLAKNRLLKLYKTQGNAEKLGALAAR